MWAYFLKRLGLSIAIIAVAMSILFVITHMIPGDPVSIALGPRATTSMKEEYRARMGIDLPVYIQYGRFVSNVLQGNLGQDVFSGLSVLDIVKRQLPHTVVLVCVAIGWSATLGIILGCFSAVRRNSILDRIIGVITVGAIASPSFVVSLYALLIFAVTLRVSPAAPRRVMSNAADMLVGEKNRFPSSLRSWWYISQANSLLSSTTDARSSDTSSVRPLSRAHCSGSG